MTADEIKNILTNIKDVLVGDDGAVIAIQIHSGEEYYFESDWNHEVFLSPHDAGTFFKPEE